MTDREKCLRELAIVLPSLDPDKKFKAVVDGLVEKGCEHIVIVDDGSDAVNELVRRGAMAVSCQELGSIC